MANPIKEIPVLTGSDARRFERWMKENESKKIDSKELERIRAVYSSVKIVDKRESVISTGA